MQRTITQSLRFALGISFVDLAAIRHCVDRHHASSLGHHPDETRTFRRNAYLAYPRETVCCVIQMHMPDVGCCGGCWFTDTFFLLASQLFACCSFP
jgi:hypothetical protein